MRRAIRNTPCVALLTILGCAAEIDGAADGPKGSYSTVASSTAGHAGTVSGTGGVGLNVRAAPSTSSGVVTWLAEGTSVTIDCQTRGDSVRGNDVWDYIPARGGYVADAFVATGYASSIPGVPRCGEDGGGARDDEEGSACGDVDYGGYCDEDVLVWCEGDAIRRADCAAAGKTCGYQSDAVGWNCLGAGGGSSGRLTIGEIVDGVGYSVTQDYGPTTFDGGYSYCQAYGSWGGRLVHCGIDIGIPYGTRLRIPENGTVVVSGETPYYEDETNRAAGELRVRTGDGTEIILGHMSRIDVWTGQVVSRGDSGGVSGTANGPHVHIEVRVPDAGYASGFRSVDPAIYFGL